MACWQWTDVCVFLWNCPKTPYILSLPKNNAVTPPIFVDARKRLGHGLVTNLSWRVYVVNIGLWKFVKQSAVQFSMGTAWQIMVPLPRSILESLYAHEKMRVGYRGYGRRRNGTYACSRVCPHGDALRDGVLVWQWLLLMLLLEWYPGGGAPTYVISDNGTYFTGAEREMGSLVENLDQEKVIRQTTVYQLIE